MRRSPEPDEALPSPLTLLLEEASDAEVTAEEILFLSYTLDLGFYERAALGVSHALGARVTVIGDASAVTHDPRAVRRAGRSYVPGLAHCGAAFHPKLAVIAGVDHAIVAVGSGNVTMAGWGDNHELWSVLRGDLSEAPNTFTAVAEWLRALPASVRLSSNVAEALQRVAARLESLPANTSGPYIVSSLTGRIIDQLPSGPVDALDVCAPFHDKDAGALQALVARLDPKRLTVAVQPRLTAMNGIAVDALVSERGGVVVALDSDRYRHGKLIEWEVDGTRWALTGSPNCTSAALRRSVAEGGNCELGLVTRISSTRMPSGDAMARERVRAHAWVLRSEPRPAIVLLGATRTEGGLELLLARPAPAQCHIELSPPAAQPDSWTPVGTVAPGETACVVTWAAEGGSRVRVAAGTEWDERVLSNVVFVLDAARALRRPRQGGERYRTTEPFDLFRDAGLAEAFVADLGGLRTGLPAAAVARSGSGGQGSKSSSWIESYGSWDAYLDECAGRLGHSLVNFALGLPSFSGDASGWTDVVDAEWDEELSDDDESGLEGDAAEDVAAADQTKSPRRLPSLADQATRVRNRYRRWAERLGEAAAGLGPAERLLAVRLVLWTAAADAWPAGDRAWVYVLGRTVKALASGDVPPEVEPQTASLAAVALSVIRAEAPRHLRTVEGLLFDDARLAVEHLLPASQERYIAEYTRLLDEAFGPAVHSKVVLDLVHELLEVDPLDAALFALDGLDLVGHRHGKILHVEGPQSNPQLVALQAVATAQDHAPVGAWAGDREHWALVVWRRPDLLEVTGSDERVSWQHYVLPDLISPRVAAFTDRRLSLEYRRWASFPAQPLAPVVADLLAAVDLSAPQPPECE